MEAGSSSSDETASGTEAGSSCSEDLPSGSEVGATDETSGLFGVEAGVLEALLFPPQAASMRIELARNSSGFFMMNAPFLLVDISIHRFPLFA
jgi:hypothetical protein